MPRLTVSARRFLVSCSTATVLLLGAAGCRNAQSAYQFRPAPTGATVARPAVPAAQLLPDKPTVISAPTTISATATATRRVVARPVRQPERGGALAAPLRLRQLPLAHRLVYAAGQRPVQRGTAATDGAQVAAEVGLGTTVLGVLGIIVGPISLIGLLIWGGPVWAVLLGLSALAVLVAYLDPFR